MDPRGQMQFGPAAIQAPAPHASWPWAVTAINAQWQLQRSDAQAAALQTTPMTFDYQNTTLWCAPTWSQGKQAIAEAQALAAEHEPLDYHIRASNAKQPWARVRRLQQAVAPAAAAAVAASAERSDANMAAMQPVSIVCIAMVLFAGAVEAGIAVCLLLAWRKIRGIGSAGRDVESRMSSATGHNLGGRSQLTASSQWVELVSQAAISPASNAIQYALGQLEVMDTLQVNMLGHFCACLSCCTPRLALCCRHSMP